MSQYRVSNSQLSGTIAVPPSKSQSLRAILFSYFTEEPCEITNLLDSPDIEAAKLCCEGLKHGGTLDVGNSGILLRFLTAIASLQDRAFTITGDESICSQRPMGDLISALQPLGVTITSQNGFAPLRVKGPFSGGRARLSGHDSQPVSALLIAAAFAYDPTEIVVTCPGEIPWVQMTLDWFDRLGVRYEHKNYRQYQVPGRSSIKGFSYSVPGDLSTMSFPLAAAIASRSDLVIENVDLNESQGDKKLVSILKEMGANITIESNRMMIEPSDLRGIEVDINDCIDAITALAVIGCFAEGKTTLRNAAVAREKECDRITCLTQELRKLGAHIEEQEDGMVVHCSSLKGAPVFSHRDHRMAMALAVAGLGAEGITVVEDIDCVKKTFPHFAKTFASLGANIQ